MQAAQRSAMLWRGTLAAGGGLVDQVSLLDTHGRKGDAAARDERIGEVLNDYLDRRARGEIINETSLLAQWPELADDLRAHLDLLRNLRPEGDRLADLVAQGLLARSDDPQYPAELGAYKVLEFVGRGGMGIVLKAYEESLNRTVALKLLRPELAHDAAILLRFQREAKAAAGLRHPNIVTVYAVGAERGVPFIAMEHVEGMSLAAALRESGALPAEVAARIFRELLSGLDAAHRAGLIHRDIKSSNVLLDGWRPAARTVDASSAGFTRANVLWGRAHLPGTPFVKIADFGLARMRGGQTRLTLGEAVLGTPDYMSPEQARGAPDVDHRTDLYSAGVVLYEMLTAHPPFRTDTPTATIHRILTEEPVPPQKLAGEVDPKLGALALRLMAKRPADRFSSAAEALAALETGQRVGLPARRRRRGYQLAAAAGVVLGALLGVWGLARLFPPAEATTGPLSAWVDADAPTTLLVRRGWQGTPRVLHQFPREAGRVADVVVANAETPEQATIVAGLSQPLDGRCVFAFDASGALRWQLDLSTDSHWPDCAPPTRWRCADLLAADLDGAAGDEIVAVASDCFEYPTRVSAIAADTGEVRSTFWHTGHLSAVDVLPRFFADERPALLLAGLNNKLDGFAEPLVGDDEPLTRFDLVAVVLVLDPLAMDGLGPPGTARLPGLSPAQPYAYAFLDAPPGPDTAVSAPDVPTSQQADEANAMSIGSVAAAAYAPSDGSGPWLTVQMQRPQSQRGVGSLIVDRFLRARQYVAVSSGAEPGVIQDCMAHWRPIIQAGKRAVEPEWVLSAPGADPVIREVDRDPERPGAIRARAGSDPRLRPFHDFGEGAYISSVALVDLDGTGRTVVAAGLARRWQEINVVVFDARANEVWRAYFFSDYHWPDCAPATEWACWFLTAGNLDGEPGDELIIVGSDLPEYGTGLWIVRPTDGHVRGTFWHLGKLSGATAWPDFFGPGRAGLVVWGVNNKLDGFASPAPGDPEPIASYDVVPVLMVLDPANLDGVGPPYAQRLQDLPPARPYAYAMLDTAAWQWALRHGTEGDAGKTPSLREIAVIRTVSVPPYAPDPATSPWLQLEIARPLDIEDFIRTLLTVDRHLKLRRVVPCTGDIAPVADEFWQQRWVPLMAEGRVLDATERKSATSHP